jgi:transcriptional regulator with XRE-family HTH domain
MAHVGQQVRNLREAKGWKQAKLAVEADLAISGVSQIENGKRNPNSETLVKLARALEVEVGNLFPKGQSPLPFEHGERRPKISGNLVDINTYELEKAIDNLPPDYPVDNFIASIAEDMERRLRHAAEELRGQSA